MQLTENPKRQPNGTYTYRDWRITPLGGYSMVRHFYAARGSTGIWACRLKTIVALCDDYDAGKPIPQVYLQPFIKWTESKGE